MSNAHSRMVCLRSFAEATARPLVRGGEAAKELFDAASGSLFEQLANPRRLASRNPKPRSVLENGGQPALGVKLEGAQESRVDHHSTVQANEAVRRKLL